MAPISPRTLPAKIGPYQVRSSLGRGGMGLLYLAVDPRIDREVALKVLREGSAEFRARFLREARSAGRLSHPNIVTVFDVGADGGHPYIAMEYVLGETLNTIITQRRVPLSQHRRLQLAVQLCDGLAFAHRFGVVHRDIKPSNLMVSRESGLLKILDFGIARSGESKLTQSGVPMGTLNYMSPEQAQGGSVDQRSDIFAVGLVLFELLTSRKAFPGDDEQAVIRAILEETPAPLADVNPDLDASLQAIVTRALAKSRDDRYPDLREMQDDLARVLKRVEEEQGGDTVRGTAVVDEREPGEPAPAVRVPASSPPQGYLAEVAGLRAQRLSEHVGRAESALDAGDLDETRRAITEAAIIDVDDPRTLALIDRHAQAMNERRVDEMLQRAERHFGAGELTIAIDMVDDALQLTPGADRLFDARRRIERAVAIRERDRAIARTLEDARGMLVKGNVEGALRSAREVLLTVPLHPDAMAVIEQGEAIRAERRAHEERERRVREAIEDAMTVADDGRTDDALTQLETLDQDHPLVREALGELRSQVDLERARADLLAWSDAEILRVRALQDDGADGEARSRLEAMAVRLAEPSVPGMADHLSRTRLRVTRELEMIGFITQARTCLDAQDHPGAVGWLDAVMALDPGHRAGLALRVDVDRAWEIAERRRHKKALERLVQEGLAAADQEHDRGDIAAAIARLERLASARPEVLDRLTRWRAEL